LASLIIFSAIFLLQIYKTTSPALAGRQPTFAWPKVGKSHRAVASLTICWLKTGSHKTRISQIG
jgi:hypothetical protein